MALTDLPGSQRHFGVLGLAELRQLTEDGRQLVRQRGVTATQLILQCTHHYGSAEGPRCGVASPHTPSPTQAIGTRPEALKWAKCCSLNQVQQCNAMLQRGDKVPLTRQEWTPECKIQTLGMC